MTGIFLVHWNAKEAQEKADMLRKFGYDVSHELSGPAIFREIRKKAPDIFVIDLSRLPSHGRDVALSIRQTKSTRLIPIVFIEGDPEKTARIKDHLPDATYTSWSKIQSALKRAISHPLLNPVVPKSVFDGYANASLPKKLGLKPDISIAIINSPGDFEKSLGVLPDGATIVNRCGKAHDLIIWFVRSEEEIMSGIKKIKSALAEKGGLWIVWPKKTSGIKSDLSQVVVRRIGLDAGLVDFKICSIDKTWSGLKFKVRMAK